MIIHLCTQATQPTTQPTIISALKLSASVGYTMAMDKNNRPSPSSTPPVTASSSEYMDLPTWAKCHGISGGMSWLVMVDGCDQHGDSWWIIGDLLILEYGWSWLMFMVNRQMTVHINGCWWWLSTTTRVCTNISPHASDRFQKPLVILQSLNSNVS